jgi:hypothetical protein
MTIASIQKRVFGIHWMGETLRLDVSFTGTKDGLKLLNINKEDQT